MVQSEEIMGTRNGGHALWVSGWGGPNLPVTLTYYCSKFGSFAVTLPQIKYLGENFSYRIPFQGWGGVSRN